MLKNRVVTKKISPQSKNAVSPSIDSGSQKKCGEGARAEVDLS